MTFEEFLATMGEEAKCVALNWLDDAGMLRMAHNVSTPLMPLAGYEEFGSFKLYAHDVGLVGAMTDLPQQTLMGEVQRPPD